jgi:hypothetical protein
VVLELPFAPASRIADATLSFPALTATCNGVQPFVSRTSVVRPWRKISETEDASPALIACRSFFYIHTAWPFAGVRRFKSESVTDDLYQHAIAAIPKKFSLKTMKIRWTERESALRAPSARRTRIPFHGHLASFPLRVHCNGTSICVHGP